MTTSRPSVAVLPGHELKSRSRLFAAFERAIGLEFTADASPGAVAALMLGDADLSVPQGLPTLRLVYPEPLPGSPAPVRMGDSGRLDAALRRQVLSDGFARATNGLVPFPADEILASGDDHVVWTHDRSTAEERAAIIPRELEPGETLRARLRPGAILPLLPVTSFLLRVAETNGLKRAPLRAAFLIDDPNLHRRRYGYLDFAELAARSTAEGWHVAFATIPLDAWFVDRRTVQLFRQSKPHLSLLVHGNRHVRHELARLADDESALREMSQAIGRIRRLEARTGLEVSRVMAPPHGVYSPIAARALARVGFQALCISNPYPWLGPDGPRPPLAGWRPAEFVEGLPIIPRHHIAGDREELVLRAFLRQPLIVYGHHTDAAHGLDVFSEAADRIDSLGRVTWMDLDAIARTNAETFDAGDRKLIRLYSRNTAIGLDHPATVKVEMDDVHSVDLEMTGAGHLYRGPGPHAIETTGELAVTVRRRDCVDPVQIAPPRPTPWPVGRRVLTETRDRLLPLIHR